MKLALGTAQFGTSYGIANHDGQVTRSVAKSMLQLAVEKGIDTIDTAIAYGESEACLGDVGTQGLKLVTKLPAIPVTCQDISRWIIEQVSASLGRLDVDSVYGLLLHRSEQLLRPDGNELFQALRNLKETGMVEKVGVSIYDSSELDALTPLYRFDLIQAPLNLIDRRLATSGWLHRLKQDGTEIHTRSTFLQGLMLMPRLEIPAKFRPWKTMWDNWHKWLMHHPVTAIQACLAYSLSFPEIDRVVVGADSVKQLEQIINATFSCFPVDLPDLSSVDESLINPTRWNQL